MKKIFLKSFGIYLNGREEGASAFQILEKEILSLQKGEQLFFDLSDVIVLAPSWCDEFFGEAEKKHSGRIVIDNSIHMGLKKSFDVVAEARDISFSFGAFSRS